MKDENIYLKKVIELKNTAESWKELKEEMTKIKPDIEKLLEKLATGGLQNGGEVLEALILKIANEKIYKLEVEMLEILLKSMVK